MYILYKTMGVYASGDWSTPSISRAGYIHIINIYAHTKNHRCLTHITPIYIIIINIHVQLKSILYINIYT
jgi:hypothetical protein